MYKTFIRGDNRERVDERIHGEAYAPSRKLFFALMVTGLFVFGFAIVGGSVAKDENSNLEINQISTNLPPEESVWEITQRVAATLVKDDTYNRNLGNDPKIEIWGEYESGRPVEEIEEHIVKAPCFNEQTYAYWRFGLNRPDLLNGKGLRVHSHLYHHVDTMIASLSARKVSSGAIVFVDVRYTGLDTQWDYDELKNTAGVDGDLLLGGSSRVARLNGHRELDESRLDVTCVYDYTSSILLRSRLLRSVLSYPEPLTIVISGDVACRLNQVPKTHHRIVFSNDAAGVQATQIGAFWWPQGLEGLLSYNFYGNPTATADALSITTARWQSAYNRILLLGDSIKVNLRKPSRLRLVEAMPNIRSQLLELAQEANLGLILKVTVDEQIEKLEGKQEVSSSIQFGSNDQVEHAVQILADSDFGGNSWRAQVASSIATICPAGDVYSTGRILTALYLGTVPIVDTTYMTDGGVSAKGCDDPATFWRFGRSDFPHPAPFIFVDDWNQLPTLLTELISDFPNNFNHRLELMAQYKSKLESYLRSIVLPSAHEEHHQPTTCTETPLDTDDHARLLAAAANYYSVHWYDHHKDKPDVPGATCLHNITTDMYGVDIGAPCFDAACAPPLIKQFECFPIQEDKQEQEQVPPLFVFDDVATQQQLYARLPKPHNIFKKSQNLEILSEYYFPLIMWLIVLFWQ